MKDHKSPYHILSNIGRILLEKVIRCGGGLGIGGWSEGRDTSETPYEVSKIMGILETPSGFLGIPGDSKGFWGIPGILKDSQDSSGFRRILGYFPGFRRILGYFPGFQWILGDSQDSTWCGFRYLQFMALNPESSFDQFTEDDTFSYTFRDK